MKPFKLLAALIAPAVIGISSCTQQPQHNTLTNAEKKDGWHLLFDGESLKGWHIYNKGNVPAAWEVKDGELWCNTSTKNKTRADLTTDNTYENFEMSFEWKVGKGGNSGVIFDVQEDAKYPATFMTGPEYQMLDDENSAVHKGNPYQIAGALYNVIPTNGAAKPVPFGQWNQSKFEQKNGKLTFWLNGKKTLEADMNAESWKEAIQKGNMKFYPDFGKFTKGKITLQDHNDLVYFRDIKIKEL
ncbi:3-keto-disaccharide hydrolase [Mucilaginibacter ginkgonis]|uniref:DUF1080 domain-containing protein n=1 Tax=Mucilaginibacter ginkgonis TaxID=2682091 RepID=A0A6I4INZ4_9SPHI|nr:DUF1080 domain-containing protein [Mucilaginibacter ginkgonis]QQL48315.1 DUF1080 domain-containing protein [Mucilaginibacter ginkgonis]